MKYYRIPDILWGNPWYTDRIIPRQYLAGTDRKIRILTIDGINFCFKY